MFEGEETLSPAGRWVGRFGIGERCRWRSLSRECERRRDMGGEAKVEEDEGTGVWWEGAVVEAGG